MLVGTCAIALIGCAAPSEPTVRHPVIPQPVRDLTVRQQDDSVVLRFTLPIDSIDDKPLSGPPAVEIYRATSPPTPPLANPIGTRPKRELPGRLVDTVPAERVPQFEKDGHFEFSDPLDPAELARQPGQQLFYTVRTRASRTRDSNDSNTETVRVYPAPQPVTGLRATLTEQAIVLSWVPAEQTTTGAPLEGPLTFRVYRADAGPSEAAGAVNPTQIESMPSMMYVGEVPEPEFRDANFEWGHTYVYTVRAAIRFGAQVVEAADATPVLIEAKDVFPPATPKGLEAVAVSATTGGAEYVELAWGISQEADLAGYVVYRSDQPDMKGMRLDAELLPAPTFRDTSVEPGRRYFYRVAAVDRSGNESPATAPVAVDVPAR